MVREPEPFLFEHGPNAVILLHAYAGSSNDMRMMGRALEKDDYTVYAPIFTGHATSDPRHVLIKGSTSQWQTDAQNAVQFMLDKGYQSIAIFGLSMGGIYTTKMLETYPQLVAGGTFASPVVRFGGSNVPVEFPKMAARKYDKMGTAAEEKAQGLQWIKDNVKNQLDEIETFTENVADNLNQIKVPFFIAQGGADEMIDPENGNAFKQRLIELNKEVEFHFYPDATHVLTVNSAHRELESDVRKFLAKIFEVDNDRK